MKKTFKVVMLPTEKASHIHFVTPKDNIGDNYEKVNGKLVPLKTNKLLYTDNTTEYGFPPQHLYIISDDEIKEGDWVYDSSSLPQDAPIKRIRIIDDTHYTLYGDTSRNLKCHYKKIVATTDKSIRPVCIKCNTRYGQGNHDCKYPCDHNGNLYFPQLPESFIQAYIKAYNKGNPITEVDLEIELHKWVGSTYPVGHRPTYQIKTRPDNTVIVHQSKMYTRDEVEKLCRLAYQQGQEEEAGNPHVSEDKWIQENL